MARLRPIGYSGPMSQASAETRPALGTIPATPASQQFNALIMSPRPEQSRFTSTAPQIGPTTQPEKVVSGMPKLRRIIPEQALASAQELRPYSMSEAVPGANVATRTALGVMQPLTIGDQEMASMLKRADPEIIVQRDKDQGAYYIYSPTTQKSFVINKPGISINDISNLTATIAAALPAGRAATMGGRAIAEAGIQSGLEAGQRGLGGEFNIEEPMYAGAFSAGTDLVTLWNQSRRAGQVASTAREQGVPQDVGQVAGTVARTVSTQAPPAQQAESLASIVRPDPNVVRAAEQMGLQEVLPMRVYSRNPQYVQVEQAVANIPGSAMAEGEKAALLAVSQKADEFISQFGGTRDLASLNENVVNNFNSTLDDLRVQSDLIYDGLRQAVPARTRVRPVEARAYLVSRARDLGGIKNLDSLESRILREVGSRGGVTYARLDQLRQEVGERYGAALRGNAFGDTTTFSLKGLYNVLTDAQGSAIETIASPQVKSQWDAGKALVSQRKGLEDTATSLLGREFTRPVIPQVRGAINGLLDGNVRSFEQVISGIPEQYRSSAVVSAMDNIFTRGARNQTQLNMGGFSSWWEKLSRSPTSKNALIKNMPEGAESFLNNLATISKQYSSATATVPKTGIVKAMGDFGSDNGFLAKILPMIPVAGSRISGVFSYAGPDVIKAASDLMASPDFRRIMVRGAQGQPTEQAQDAIQRSPAFKAWTETLPTNIRNRILTVGLTDYLFENSEE
jgi:hypothetical protein